MPIYRNRKEPYVHKDPLDPDLTYLMNHQPAEWLMPESGPNYAVYSSAYVKLYGPMALLQARQTFKVAENTDKDWVGPGEVYGEEEPPSDVLGPDEVWVETGFGRKKVKRTSPKLSDMTFNEFIEQLLPFLGK